MSTHRIRSSACLGGSHFRLSTRLGCVPAPEPRLRAAPVAGHHKAAVSSQSGRHAHEGAKSTLSPAWSACSLGLDLRRLLGTTCRSAHRSARMRTANPPGGFPDRTSLQKIALALRPPRAALPRRIRLRICFRARSKAGQDALPAQPAGAFTFCTARSRLVLPSSFRPTSPPCPSQYPSLSLRPRQPRSSSLSRSSSRARTRPCAGWCTSSSRRSPPPLTRRAA